MRIVATSDTHTQVDIKLIPDGDVFIHAGDLMTTGYLDEWRWATEWLAALPHKIKLYIPGNHDFHMQVYPGPALQDMRRAGVFVVGLPGNINYASHVLPNGKIVLGLPQTTNLPRWAFSSTESEIEDYLNALPEIKYDIVVSHAPVNGYLDVSNRTHSNVGCLAYRKFLDKKYQQGIMPDIWIHGHIHEGYGHIKAQQGCDIYNVAMSDRKGRHANKPIVLDI